MFFIESINSNINLIPIKYIKEIEESLEYEDSLHQDLRILTFRFIVPHFLGKKDLKKLKNKKNNKGTIKGEIDIKKNKEIDFWMIITSLELLMNKSMNPLKNFLKQ